MKLLYGLLILLCSLVLATPITYAVERSTRLVKRGLKANEETGKITDTHSGKVVGSVNQKMIDNLVKSRKASLAKLQIPYSFAIHAFYDYQPLDEGNPPVATGFPFFWPPQEGDDQIKERKAEMKKKLHDLSPEFPELSSLLEKIKTPITRVVGLGLGSLQETHVYGLAGGDPPPGYEEAQKQHMEHDFPNTRERSFRGLALALAIQEELPNKPEVFLQDPAYSEAERAFMRDSGVEVLDDPDGFAKIDENTIVITSIGMPGPWHKMNMDEETLPAAILSASFTSRKVPGVKKGDGAPEDMVNQYRNEGILDPKGETKISRAGDTLFWVKGC